MAVKRSDVAKRANVSPSVVSYVINNSNYVSEEKRAAVLKAIEELGYYPDYLAQSLKTRKTNHIAIISDDLHNEYFNELADVTEQLAYENGYFLSLFSNRSESLFRLVKTYKVDGVFLFTTKYSAEQINMLASAHIPTVLCNSIEYSGLHPDINKVTLDFYGSMKAMTNYLIEKGHRKILYLSAAPIRSFEEKNFRFQGFASAMKENGLPLEMELINYIHSDMRSLVSYVLKRLEYEINPTAIIAGNDSIALRLMGCLQKRGHRIPDDYAIVGAGNIELGEFHCPTLTTFNYNNHLLAHTVIDHLFKIREGVSVNDVMLDIELIFREST